MWCDGFIEVLALQVFIKIYDLIVVFLVNWSPLEGRFLTDVLKK